MKTECMKTGICNVCGRMAFLYGLFILFFAVAPYGACGASACVAADGAKTYIAGERIIFDWHNFLSSCSTWDAEDSNALIADSERNMPRNKKSKRRQTLCKESRARQILNQGGKHYSKNRERRHVRKNRSGKNQELWLTPPSWPDGLWECCQCAIVAKSNNQYQLGIGNIGTGNTFTIPHFTTALTG